MKYEEFRELRERVSVENSKRSNEELMAHLHEVDERVQKQIDEIKSERKIECIRIGSQPS
jgi:hypothetical protein